MIPLNHRIPIWQNMKKKEFLLFARFFPFFFFGLCKSINNFFCQHFCLLQKKTLFSNEELEKRVSSLVVAVIIITTWPNYELCFSVCCLGFCFRCFRLLINIQMLLLLWIWKSLFIFHFFLFCCLVAVRMKRILMFLVYCVQTNDFSVRP